MSNVIPFDRDNEAKTRIKEIEDLLEKNELGWMEGSVRLGMAYAEYRDCHPSDIAFSVWLTTNGLGRRFNANDQAALINMGRHPEIMRAVLEETSSRSYQLTWIRYRSRFPNTRKPTTSIPEPPKIVTLAAPEMVSTSVAKPDSKPDSIPVPAKRESASPPTRYPVPEKSKLREMIGSEAADILLSRFKSGKWIFTAQVKKVHNDTRALFNYLAKRCQQADYPPELFLASTWSNQLLYPLLPKRLIDALPTFGSALYKVHTILVETERHFALAPEFGITDPPLAAYNKAYAIYTALTNARKGHTVDPAAIHRPTFGDDEGKPPVIVRGTKLWPAETGAGYRYDDLRCACGLAEGILSAFDEQRPSVSSKTLKLRHIRSWLSGGYNSTGATADGTLKAFNAVIQAWSWNVSEEMQNPLPSMIKNDGDQR